MNERFVYVEFQFPQDLKDLYWGEAGTGILKMLLDQYIQETDCPDGKLLLDMDYEDAAIFSWKKNNFAFSLQFVNDTKMTTWKNSRSKFVEWVENIHEIVQVYYEEFYNTKEEDVENNSFWKKRKYFFEDIPEKRGFNPHNIITGVPTLFSEN